MHLTQSLLCCCLLVVISSHALSFPVGINIDPTNPAGNPNVSAILATGASWVRLEYKTVSTQNVDSVATSLQDYATVIAQLNSAGVRTLVILDYMTVAGTPWGGTASQWAAYTETFANAIQPVLLALSTMEGGYEVWNEEDLSQTHVPPGPYAGLLRAVYTAVKAVNTNHLVVMGGLASGDPTYVSQVMSAEDGILYADQIGLHPYGQRPYPNWPSSSWGFGYVGSLVSAYRSVAPSKPLMITEVGTNDVSVEGEFPSMIFSSLSSMSNAVSAVIWFCWSDGMVAPFGLVTADQHPKADYWSYLNFTRS